MVVHIMGRLFIVINLCFALGAGVVGKFAVAFQSTFAFTRHGSRNVSCCHGVQSDNSQQTSSCSNDNQYDYVKFKYNPSLHLRKEFQRTGILYKKSILSDTEFQMIKSEILKIPHHQFQNEKSNSVARHRIGMTLGNDSNIAKVLCCENGSLHRFANEIAGSIDSQNEEENRIVMSRVIPLELRIYEQVGSGMEWHQDDALFDPAQIEVVLTIENNSDCVTKWELPSDYNNYNIYDENSEGTDSDNCAAKRVEVETEPNSALFIKAGKNGVSHFVSSLRSGRRSILKFVFIQEGAELLDDAKYHINQFSSSKNKMSNHKKKIRRK